MTVPETPAPGPIHRFASETATALLRMTKARGGLFSSPSPQTAQIFTSRPFCLATGTVRIEQQIIQVPIEITVGQQLTVLAFAGQIGAVH